MRHKIVYSLVILFGLFVLSLIFFYPLGRVMGGVFARSDIGSSIAAYPEALKEVAGKRKGGYVAYADIPQCLRQAIISVEDKRFFSHSGIDPFAAIRVFFENFKNDDEDHGGSTIGQQLARAILKVPRAQPSLLAHIGSRFTVMRGTLILEHDYSKEKILELYLNSIYFGRGANGIAAAAQAYFGKNLGELNESQCIYLAGLPQTPTTFGLDPEGIRTLERYTHVVATMQRNGYLTEESAHRVRAGELFPHRDD